tara:strand:+ start:212 stop:898 length:687 start_codon:yes stop_codon:yes gene_type:complete
MKIKLSELKRKSRKIALSFSDTEVGTDEYGFIPRIDGEDPDDEDDRYQAYLKKQGISAVVAAGDIFLRENKMKIKLSELKRIIREELELSPRVAKAVDAKRGKPGKWRFDTPTEDDTVKIIDDEDEAEAQAEWEMQHEISEDNGPASMPLQSRIDGFLEELVHAAVTDQNANKYMDAPAIASQWKKYIDPTLGRAYSDVYSWMSTIDDKHRTEVVQSMMAELEISPYV